MKNKKKLLLILFSVLTFSSVHAQIKIYKIQNGSKTEINNEGPVKIELNGEGKPIDNLLFELDLKKFREKHKFDLINIAVGRPGFNSGLIRHEFDSDLSKKKYADVTQFNFYAFGNSEYKEDKGSFAVVSNQVFFKQGDMQFTYYFKILGQYITGQETYYDENSRSVKTRDVYSDGELIISLDVEYEQSQSAEVEARYKEHIQDDWRIRRHRENLKTCARNLEKITVGIGPLLSPKYKYLVNALYEIAEHKFNEISQEEDKAKALEVYDAWVKEKDSFCIEETKSNKENLKILNKELGEVSTIQERIELIRNTLK